MGHGFTNHIDRAAGVACSKPGAHAVTHTQFFPENELNSTFIVVREPPGAPRGP